MSANKTLLGWQGNGFSGLVSRNIEWNPHNPTHLILQGMDGAKAVQSWDAGRNWRIENPGLPAYSGGYDVAFAPGYIFAVFGQGNDDSELIARSSDLGMNWSLLKAPVSPAEATQVHVDPDYPDRLWVVVDQQLWFSRNATQTTPPQWTQLNVGSEGNPVGRIEAVSDQSTAFYIATDNGVDYTAEGLDFAPVGGLKDAKNVSIAITPSNPNTLYAAEGKSYLGDYGVWRYTVLDNSWARVWNNRDVTARIGDIAVHPYSSNILATITEDHPFRDETQASGVWLSKDGGENWQQEIIGLPLLRGGTIEFSPDGQSLAVGLGGGGFYIADL